MYNEHMNRIMSKYDSNDEEEGSDDNDDYSYTVKRGLNCFSHIPINKSNHQILQSPILADKTKKSQNVIINIAEKPKESRSHYTLDEEIIRMTRFAHPKAIVIALYTVIAVELLSLRENDYSRYILPILNVLFAILLWLYTTMTTKKVNFSVPENSADIWYATRNWIKSMAVPMLLVWSFVQIHHIIWSGSGLYQLNNTYTFLSISVSIPIVACALYTVGEFQIITLRLEYIKWLMLLVGFIFPLWRSPWFEEYRLFTIGRILMFTIIWNLQNKQYWSSDHTKRTDVGHCTIIRSVWVVFVHPLLLSVGIIIIIKLLVYNNKQRKNFPEYHEPDTSEESGHLLA